MPLDMPHFEPNETGNQNIDERTINNFNKGEERKRDVCSDYKSFGKPAPSVEIAFLITKKWKVLHLPCTAH